MRLRPLILAAVAVASSTILSGCSLYRSAVDYINSDKPIICPDSAILASTASLPAFDPNVPTDPSNILYTVEMTDVSTTCDIDKREHSSDSTVKFFYTATRAPGGPEATYKVPYFIAVSNEGNISQKKIYWLEVTFDRGETVVKGKESVDDLEVKAAKGKEPAEYRFVVGFQLTQAQIDYNKKIGRYVQ